MTATSYETDDLVAQRVAQFWAYAAERHAIWTRRKQGLEPPWTADPVLQRYRFSNVYRDLDPTCQALFRRLDRVDPWAAAAQAFAFRGLTNRLHVLRAWGLPDPTHEGLDRWFGRLLAYERCGADVRSHTGFIVSRGRLKTGAHELLDGQGEMSYTALREKRELGPFYTAVVFSDLLGARIVTPRDQFIPPGRGSSAALHYLATGELRLSDTDYGKNHGLYERLHEQGFRFGPSLPIPLVWYDLEQTLCEFFKYKAAGAGIAHRLAAYPPRGWAG